MPLAVGRLQKRSLVEEAERRFGPLRPIPSKNGNIVLAVSTAGKIGGGFIAQGGHSRGKVTAIKARGKRRDFIPLFVRVKSVQAPKKLRFLPIARSGCSDCRPIPKNEPPRSWRRGTSNGRQASSPPDVRGRR